MAQRDEGLARLESFNALAAQVRAGLQRDAGRVDALAHTLGAHFGDVEARLVEMDDAIDAFDSRCGDRLQIVLAVSFGADVGLVVATAGLFPLAVPLAIVAGIAAYLVLGEVRLMIVNSGDLAIAAYHGLAEASARLRPALSEAADAAEQAFDGFSEATEQVMAAPGELLQDALGGHGGRS
jgi:hypothetical protein